jgi:hypothetical protein
LIQTVLCIRRMQALRNGGRGPIPAARAYTAYTEGSSSYQPFFIRSLSFAVFLADHQPQGIWTNSP